MKIQELLEYPVLLLKEEGGQYFHGLLNASDKDLGWQLPTVKLKGHPIELIEMIGEGATSIVFKGKLQDSNEVCVKYFRKKDLRMKREKENLEVVEKLANEGKVTKLVGISDDEDALIVTPVGIHFACTCEQIGEVVKGFSKSNLALSTAADFCSLIDIIAEVHKCGLIHRDIKQSNFFRYDNQVSTILSLSISYLFIFAGFFE